MNTDHVILRLRRDLTLSALVRVGLMIAMLIVALAGPITGLGASSGAAVAAILVIWMFLQARSLQRAQMAGGSPGLIAAGQYDLAEQSIARSFSGFALQPNAKLLSVYHLAMLRKAQDRHPETVLLCQALLEKRGKALGEMEKPVRLLLANSMLRQGNLHGCHEAIAGLYEHRLDLPQAMELLALELELQARSGAWGQMLNNAPSKIDLAEVMPPDRSAVVQAFLSLAARESGLSDLSHWLKKRVTLLSDPQKLTVEHPVLTALFA